MGVGTQGAPRELVHIMEITITINTMMSIFKKKQASQVVSLCFYLQRPLLIYDMLFRNQQGGIPLLMREQAKRS